MGGGHQKLSVRKARPSLRSCAERSGGGRARHDTRPRKTPDRGRERQTRTAGGQQARRGRRLADRWSAAAAARGRARGSGDGTHDGRQERSSSHGSAGVRSRPQVTDLTSMPDRPHLADIATSGAQRQEAGAQRQEAGAHRRRRPRQQATGSRRQMEAPQGEASASETASSETATQAGGRTPSPRRLTRRAAAGEAPADSHHLPDRRSDRATGHHSPPQATEGARPATPSKSPHEARAPRRRPQESPQASE